MQIKALIKSMRLRTLPLSLAGVMLGGLMGHDIGNHSIGALVFLFLTTVSLQILSNLSNELGDHLSGVDGKDRVGPNYSLSEGGLTVKQMWRAINGMVVACCIFGILMVLTSHCPWWILLIGAAAIWAATHYTLGKNPYGYKGLGDLFVFIFFGLVSVIGSYFVMAHSLAVWIVFPAIGIGLLSVAVLNVNNIRDIDSDRGKRITVPLKIGWRRACIYQTILVVLGWLLIALSFGGHQCQRLIVCRWLMLCTLPLFVWHIACIWGREGKDLDPMLPLLVMSTFLVSLICTIGNYGL